MSTNEQERRQQGEYEAILLAVQRAQALNSGNLPPPYIWFNDEARTVHQTDMTFDFLKKCTALYTADQMRAYAKQAIESRILGQQGGGDAAKVVAVDFSVDVWRNARRWEWIRDISNSDEAAKLIPRFIGCDLDNVVDAAIQAQAGEAREGGSRG